MARMGSSRVILLATAILAFADLAVAQQFNYKTVSIAGWTNTAAYGINDFGVIVGFYDNYPGNSEHGFMKTGAGVTNVDYPGAASTICYAINNSGEVVGQYTDTEGFLHAFQYENGTYTNIDPPGAKEAGAGGINNVGQIVGSYTDFANGEHGFILQGGTYQTLDVPGAEFTNWAGGINDSGQVTLIWTSTNNTGQSSIYQGGNYTEIQITGSQDVDAYGINNKGDIALVWLPDGSLVLQTELRIPKPHGGYAYPSITDPQGGDTTRAYGVSNQSVVVGTYEGPKGYLGFLAIPLQ